MVYGVAAHGIWCGAKTYPTRCRYCHEQVFYFECRCGSKVFFSELGGSWPEHRCLQLLIHRHGKEFVERGMAAQMMQHPASRLVNRVERRYVESVRQQYERRRGAERWTRRIEASAGAQIRDRAVIREAIRTVDVYAKTDVSPFSSLARQFLGVLRSDDFGQITLYVGDLAYGDPQSYTCFIKTELLDKLRIERGDLVRFFARAIRVGSDKNFWLCSEIDVSE